MYSKPLCCSRSHVLLLALLLGSFAAASAIVRADAPSPTLDPVIEQKVAAVLSQLTIEEKIGLCSGTGHGFRGVSRLGIPDLSLTDGPRGPNGGGTSTAFPCGVCLGSMWNPELIENVGKVMGNETRARGAGILLGPGLNIQRDPLGGRFFEYYTEDPYLNARVASSIILGIQSEGVAACMKHYICNNREVNRNNYMSMVNERTLHEIYMPGFKSGVQDGHAMAVMTSANGVNGDFVSDSKELLNDTLKGEWGFQGMVLTDWLQTRSTEKAAFAGLDVSMPGGNCGFAQPLLDAVKAGLVPQAVIDDKSRRVLRVYAFIGLLDKRDLSLGADRNTPEHQKVARQAATEGIVLLKNEHQTLPLDPDRVKKVLVIGPSADRHFNIVALGGSSWIHGPYEITALAGIRNVLGNDKVDYLATDDISGFVPLPASVMQPIKNVAGFQATYTSDKPGASVSNVVPQLNFNWDNNTPDPQIPAGGFRAEFTGTIIPPITGTYTLRVNVGGSATLYDEPGGGGAPFAAADRGDGNPVITTVVQMQKGKPFYLHINYSTQGQDPSLNVTWAPPGTNITDWTKLDQEAKAADAVVFAGGIDQSIDCEGRDRLSMDFPSVQQQIIDHVAKVNRNTIVVLYNGSPMDIHEWVRNVPAVVDAWYPGMEGGNALSDILFGKVDPSGRLSFSWPKQLADAPSRVLATQDQDHVNYTDGLLVGYRYYDTRDVEPLFPFGYGLSYTSFSFAKMHASTENGHASVSLTLKNSGKRDGIETVQIYVHPEKPSVFRPVHELKAFQKVAIKQGASQTLNFDLAPDAFSYYDATSKQWTVDPGEYTIEAGESSRKILATTTVKISTRG
jgi:beta-glucosidase